MTRAEAIHIIEEDIQIDVRSCTNEEVHTFITALNMAISALREQEERSKGCEHCLSGINKSMMLAHGYACCTDCGRRLEEV